MTPEPSARQWRESPRAEVAPLHLPVLPAERRLMRLDAATIFKRFFHLERALTIALGGWVPEAAFLESKAAMAQAAWQNALTAEALRNRVLELRYPDRTLDRGADEPLITLYESSIDAPSGVALLELVVCSLAPALTRAYESYLAASDPVADGPTFRFLEHALEDKRAQIIALERAAVAEASIPSSSTEASAAWVAEMEALLASLGGVRLEDPPAAESTQPAAASGRPFRLRELPARDPRYLATSFYWPDNFDPDLPYGEGFRLQLRSAISHLNEVWAVDTAGAILQGLADPLGWEWILEAARWLFDESRHMMMGRRRLERWGFEPASIPLGDFIYVSCRGEDIIQRLAMLAYFETKNIGNKRDRTELFRDLGDGESERDMDFDWADEALHANLGRKWMRAALKERGADAEQWRTLVARCEFLVEDRVRRATAEEKHLVRAAAEELISVAARLARPAAPPDLAPLTEPRAR